MNIIYIPLIVIDPGHGGSDRANRGPTGYVEADGVLDVALKLRDLLVKKGYRVKLTRGKDETVTLYKRAEKANQWKGDLFISLHTNAGVSTANGIETFHTLNNEWGRKDSAEAKRVATIVQRKLVVGTGLRDRGIKTRLVDNPTSPVHSKDYYAVIRRSNMPAIITEMGFHTNIQEESLLKTEVFRQKLAQELCEGIQEAYPLSQTNESQGNKKIEVEARELKIEIHGKAMVQEVWFREGRNSIPINFLKNFGYAVEWNDKTQTAEIDYKK